MSSFSDSWALLANPVPVTLFRKTGSTTFAPGVVITFCKVYQFTQAHIEGAVVLRERVTTASLWREKLAEAGVSIPPKPHDVIEVSGVRHTVTSVDGCGRDQEGADLAYTRYRCRLTREVT